MATNLKDASTAKKPKGTRGDQKQKDQQPKKKQPGGGQGSDPGRSDEMTAGG